MKVLLVLELLLLLGLVLYGWGPDFRTWCPGGRGVGSGGFATGVSGAATVLDRRQRRRWDLSLGGPRREVTGSIKAATSRSARTYSRP